MANNSIPGEGEKSALKCYRAPPRKKNPTSNPGYKKAKATIIKPKAFFRRFCVQPFSG
jgi:hypothetical protein